MNNCNKYFLKMRFLQQKCIFILCVFLIISLSACGKRPLSEKDLSKIIPEEILTYHLDDVVNKMSIRKLTIERRQTNKKEDTVFAILSMEDDYIHKTAFYIISINYYDKGGWIIDSWEKNKETEAYPLQPPSENLIAMHLGRRYRNFNLVSSEIENLKEGNCSFVFHVNNEEQYLSRNGHISILYTLIGSDDLYWIPTINIDDLKISWNVIGEWSFTQGSNIWNLNIRQITDNDIHASGNIRQRSFNRSFPDSISNDEETISFQWSTPSSVNFAYNDWYTFYIDANDARVSFSGWFDSRYSNYILRKSGN